MDANFTEHMLAQKAHDGDRHALDMLVENARGRLFSTAYRELKNHEDSQDVVAAALLYVCVHINELREPACFSAWVKTIVLREAQKARRGLQTVEFAPELAGSDDSDLDRILMRIDIERALRILPAMQARALTLFYFEGLSVSEVAIKVCGRDDTPAMSRVRQWLHRGRHGLLIEMKEYATMTAETTTTELLSEGNSRSAAIIHSRLKAGTVAALSDVLGGLGYQVAVLTPPTLDIDATNLDELLGRLQHFDVIIVDHKVGARSGLEFVLFCAAHQETANTQLVMLHSKEDDALTAAACYAAGAIAVAEKHIAENLRDILQRHEQKTADAWRHFTPRTRTVVEQSQNEAVKLGSRFVSTEHILLSLINQVDSAGSRILTERFGLNLQEVRERIEKRIKQPSVFVGSPVLTSLFKNAISLSAHESKLLNVPYIGTEHLLLGLARQSSGLAVEFLTTSGVRFEELHRVVSEWQGTN